MLPIARGQACKAEQNIEPQCLSFLLCIMWVDYCDRDYMTKHIAVTVTAIYSNIYKKKSFCILNTLTSPHEGSHPERKQISNCQSGPGYRGNFSLFLHVIKKNWLSIPPKYRSERVNAFWTLSKLRHYFILSVDIIIIFKHSKCSAWIQCITSDFLCMKILDSVLYIGWKIGGQEIFSVKLLKG